MCANKFVQLANTNGKKEKKPDAIRAKIKSHQQQSIRE